MFGAAVNDPGFTADCRIMLWLAQKQFNRALLRSQNGDFLRLLFE
jgi:hypothetical protein